MAEDEGKLPQPDPKNEKLTGLYELYNTVTRGLDCAREKVTDKGKTTWQKVKDSKVKLFEAIASGIQKYLGQSEAIKFSEDVLVALDSLIPGFAGLEDKLNDQPATDQGAFQKIFSGPLYQGTLGLGKKNALADFGKALKEAYDKA